MRLTVQVVNLDYPIIIQLFSCIVNRFVVFFVKKSTFLLILFHKQLTYCHKYCKIFPRCEKMINLTEKLKIAMIKQNVTQLQLAERTEQSQQNLSKKIAANNFKLSEYQRLVEALGCTLEVNIILPNGDRL